MYGIFHKPFFKMTNKNKKIKFVIYLSILTVGVAAYSFWPKTKQDHVILTNTSINNNLVEVRVVTVKKEKVQLFVDLPARVKAHKIAEIRPQIDGIIKKIIFSEGSFVKQGQQLYQIDPALYQIALDNANAALKTLRYKFERYQKLILENAISQQEFDDVRAVFLQAQADVEKAKTNLTYTKVNAPISGYIGKSNMTEGALVSTNQSEILATLTQLDPIYVDLVQSSKETLQLGDQDDITVTLLSQGSDEKHVGKLKFSEKFADVSTDSVLLRAVFPNKEKKLIPGMFVHARLHLKPFEAVTIPQRATNRTPDGRVIIWVLGKDNKVASRPIKVSQITGDSWIVDEGLQGGEVVIYEGFQKIAEGLEVKAVPLEPVLKTGEKE